jgi:hypothetical protein
MERPIFILVGRLRAIPQCSMRPIPPQVLHAICSDRHSRSVSRPRELGLMRFDFHSLKVSIMRSGVIHGPILVFI